MKTTDPVATFLAVVLWIAFLGAFTASLVQEVRAIYAACLGWKEEMKNLFWHPRALELYEEAAVLALQGGYLFAGSIVPAGFLLVARNRNRKAP